jgi:DNA/RNA-binding domain of Phe-tRNA-synthetase-like protein
MKSPRGAGSAGAPRRITDLREAIARAASAMQLPVDPIAPSSPRLVLEISLHVDPHPLLKVAAFTTTFATTLAETATPSGVLDALRLDGPAPLQRDEAARAAVRDLLRHSGYKPTGRGKPASEYLVRAATEGALGSINAAVDVCNAVSLHSGLPISVVDLDRARAPFRIGVAPPGASYVFNASGQEIDLTGLLCLFDAEGPCANAVRDAQRTKTRGETRATLSVVWGCTGFETRLHDATRWHRDLLASARATTHDVALAESEPHL